MLPKNGYHWNDVRAVSENVDVAIVEAFRKKENANIDKLQGIFGDEVYMEDYRYKALQSLTRSRFDVIQNLTCEKQVKVLDKAIEHQFEII